MLLRSKNIIPVLALLLLASCKGPRGDRGDNGSNGQSGQSGPPGLPGTGSGTIPFSYEGTATFPTETATQTIAGFSLDSGDLINVYISWDGQPWTQIGSTWVGGMAGSYAVVGNVVTVTVVIGPAHPTWKWAMNGIKSISAP